MKTKLEFLLALNEETASNKILKPAQVQIVRMEIRTLFLTYSGVQLDNATRSQIVAERNRMQTVNDAINLLMNLQTRLDNVSQQQTTSISSLAARPKKVISRPQTDTDLKPILPLEQSSSSTSSTSLLREVAQQESTSASTSTATSSLAARPKRVILRPQPDTDLQHISTLNLSSTSSNRRSASSRVKKIEDPESVTQYDAQKHLVERALKKLNKRNKNKPRFQESRSLLSISATPSTIKEEIRRSDESIATSSSTNEGAVLERKSRFTILKKEQLEGVRNSELSSTSLSTNSTADTKDKGVVIAGKLPTTFPSPPSSPKRDERDR